MLTAGEVGQTYPQSKSKHKSHWKYLKEVYPARGPSGVQVQKYGCFMEGNNDLFACLPRQEPYC